MDSSLIITLEILLVLGVVLGLGGWDLWKLRREQARDRAQAAARIGVPSPGGLQGERLASGPAALTPDGVASGKAAGPAPTEH
jgi:hypothetical protein